jgi:predicted nucleic acid-binding protein
MTAAVVDADGRQPQPTAFDTSALLCRYLGDHRRPLVERELRSARYPVVTSLVHGELMLGLQLAAERSRGGGRGDDLWTTVAADWSRFWVLPVSAGGADALRAARLGVTYGLTITNALHLVALERLPRPCRLLTFDDRQVAAAVDLGIDIAEPQQSDDDRSTAHGLILDR